MRLLAPLAPLRTLSLFSGIGGLDLGLERSGGFEIVAQCEADEFCQLVLAKHWPDVPIFTDVTQMEISDVDELQVDCICGGFPCQDISVAGKGKGLEGERSGLWREMLRLIAGVRPRWLVIENVPALRTRGADRVFGDLEEQGYTCWPCVVGACDTGAPHQRKRVFIVAHTSSQGLAGRRALPVGAASEITSTPGSGGDGWRWPSRPGEDQYGWEEPRLAYPLHGAGDGKRDERNGGDQCGDGDTGAEEELHGSPQRSLGGADDGLSPRLVRLGNRGALRAFGNAVVPQVAEAVGLAVVEVRKILEKEQAA